MKKLIEKLNSILIVPNTFDPDDLRRRQILNTVLIFLILASTVQVVATYWDENLILAIQTNEDNNALLVITGGIAVFIVFLILNRSSRLPRNLIGWTFIVSMVGLFSISDFPRELTIGRSIFIWAVPVALSVIILPPAAVFVVDLLITIVFLLFSKFEWENFASYTLLEIYVVSLISWIGMSIAERAIRDARNESRTNRAILDGVADGVIVFGMSNKVVLANPAAEELINGEATKILPAVENTEIGGHILSLRWNNVQGVGRVAIIRDISRQVEVERAKDAVLGVVSHEMRTPLAAIMGLTESLASTSLPSPDRLERIRANAQRMMTLIDDLLDQAHIEAGVLKLHNEGFSPTSLANAIQDAFGARAREKQIALNVSVSEILPPIMIGDAHRYQQILTNLVDNALKFTKEEGCVDVRLAPCADADKWQMIVSDTGIGIPPERLPDIFLPFRRASDYAKRSCQGAGLGLSIAKRIAQLALGDIEVKSMVGHGSTFTVTLPMNGGVS